MNQRQLTYNATKTAEAYHADDSEVRLLMGPVGCGKSVTSCIESFARSLRQEVDAHGIRRTRGAIIRNTYPELKATTIKTWTAWFPESLFGKVKYDSPIVHYIKTDELDIEVYFLALDKPGDIQKLKSFELTWAYLNELQFIDEQVFLTCRERINRFPAKKDGVSPTFTGVMADANPPSTHHWIYEAFEKNRPSNYKIFKYPPAVLKVDEVPEGAKYAISKDGSYYINNPDADYVVVQNDPNYWLRLVEGNRDDKIKVDLMGQYGVVSSGKPVHETYNDSLHFSNKNLEYNPDIELGLGWDFGLTPAVAIVQLTPRGKFVVLDELYATHMGLRDFAKNIVIPHLDRHYAGWREKYISRHDPAGSTGSQTDGKSCEDILYEEGIISEPAAENNDPTLRRDSLKFFLGRMTDGQPAFQLSSKCQMIREGLIGEFQYARMQIGGEARYHEKPLKNMHSHICEGLEYIAIHYSSENKKPSAPKASPFKRSNNSFMAQ